jgi:hypothetical protein
MYFRFRPSKAKCIGNVLTNRRNAAIRSIIPNLPELIGEAVLTEQKACEILTGNYRRYNIVAHCLMTQGASLRQYISAGSDVPSLVLRLLRKKESLQVFTAFCLFVRTLPIHFALLGRKRKDIKSKTTAKL